MKEKLSRFQISISSVVRKFDHIEKRRESLIKDTRDVLSYCSKSIIAIHSGDQKSSENYLETARAKLEGLKKLAENDLERYLIPAETELVEAYCFYALVRNSQLPSIDELNVSAASYILGLLDVIGEVKRRIYDLIRNGRQKEAYMLFEKIEDIYSTLKPLAVYDNLAPGIRRKLDTDRILLEDIRGLLTEEARREKLLDSLKSVQSRLRRLEKNSGFKEESG
ncbi:MAG: hypothetical protein QXT39_02880 [Conexivisphaerales archaeon]